MLYTNNLYNIINQLTSIKIIKLQKTHKILKKYSAVLAPNPVTRDGIQKAVF